MPKKNEVKTTSTSVKKSATRTANDNYTKNRDNIVRFLIENSLCYNCLANSYCIKYCEKNHIVSSKQKLDCTSVIKMWASDK